MSRFTSRTVASCLLRTSGAQSGIPRRSSAISTIGSCRTRSGSRRPSVSTPSRRERSSGMPVAIITGAGGLIGSEAVDHFIAQGFDVVGIENDMRARFFGPESSTSHVTTRLNEQYPGFKWENVDIRDAAEIMRI